MIIPGKDKRRMGIMGGTFDPIHNGHLLAAELVREEFNLSQVVFVPAAQPPHKAPGEVSSAEHRYIMTLLAVTAHPWFTVSDIELRRPGPSYTIDTVRAFRQLWGDDVGLYFITGLDAICDITTWKDYRALLEECRFVAVNRPGVDPAQRGGLVAGLGPLYDRIHFMGGIALALSASQIRTRVRAGQSLRFLVPEAVEHYIKKNRLYSLPCADSTPVEPQTAYDV